MSNYIGNRNVVSDEIFAVMKKLHSTMGRGIVFGGSLTLVANGLITRPVSDIDVIVPNTTSIPRELARVSNGDYVINSRGQGIERFGLLVDGIKICVFKQNDGSIRYERITFEREDCTYSMRFNNVSDALYYKSMFQSSNPKHKRDLDAIKANLQRMMSSDVLVQKAREYYNENMVGEPLCSTTIIDDMVAFVKYVMKDSSNTEQVIVAEPSIEVRGWPTASNRATVTCVSNFDVF